MAKRIAFVSNAKTGDELRAGTADATRVYKLLLDPEVGCCIPSSPEPLYNCESRTKFQDNLSAILNQWDEGDQLILYFSGHGQVKGKRYGLTFGAEQLKTFLPFDNIIADLQSHGVTRAIIILDSCESGSIVEPGEKGAPDLGINSDNFPKGIVFLASSRKRESSYELPDGSASLFTHLLAEGLETGLGGNLTDDDTINAEDIIKYIHDRLSNEEYSIYPQKPVYSIHSAERHIWLAKNKSKKQKPKNEPHTARSLDELRFLYERTAESRHPCFGAKLSELDLEVINTYTKSAGINILSYNHLQQEAKQIGLYSPIDTSQLHNAAVLCFAKRPELLIPQARAIFIAGKKTQDGFIRQDITGPLPTQYRKLIDLTEKAIAPHLLRQDITSQTFFSAIREAISNAIAHRNYGQNGVIRVTVQYPSVEIVSPGNFPKGRSWKSLLEGEHVSDPIDAAIAWYLTTSLAFEGVGRGFEIFSDYIKLAGNDHLICHEINASGVIRISITDKNAAKHHPQKPPPESVPQSSYSMPRYTNLESVWEFGELIKLGRMQIIRILGKGGVGTVYLAYDTALNRHVAIKILPLRFFSSRHRERFTREAQIGALLHHQCIVSVYDTGFTEEQMYIVMEYIEGETIYEWVLNQQLENKDEAHYYTQVATILQLVANALHYAHSKGVIHRDIKPQNILLDKNNIPHICDFGIAAVLNPENIKLTLTGEVVGTPFYMSPEQCTDGEKTDLRTDIYSLGLTMFEMLTMTRPFTGDNFINIFLEKIKHGIKKPRDLKEAIPKELERICLKASSISPTERYQSAIELVEDLHRFIHGSRPA